MVRPKKHLGQHFLTDPSIAGRIVDALHVPPGDTVLESGPGTGVLTGLLLVKDIHLLPVEIDPDSVVHLKQKWPELEDRIIALDFLKMENTEEFLQGLARRNLFVQSNYDDKKGWVFRYHQLFRDFLRAKFRSEIVEKERCTLFLKAGSLYEEKGELE